MSVQFRRVNIGLLFAAILGLMAISIPVLSRPPFDAHNFRQAQTLATIELFARDGIDLLHPRTNYVGEPGTFVLEFPIFQAVCATAYQLFGPHIYFVRGFNLLLTAGSATALFLLSNRYLGSRLAIVPVVLFLFGPLNLLYCTSTLIDPSAVCCALWTFYLVDLFVHPPNVQSYSPGWNWIILTVVGVLCALIKALYLFPVCVWIGMAAFKYRSVTKGMIKVAFSLGLAGAAFLAWNRYAISVNDKSAFTAGIHPTSLLGSSQLFDSTFYRLSARRLLLDLLGPVGGAFIVVGCSSLPWAQIGKERRVLSASILTISGYWITFSNIITPHDYYSLIVAPFAAVAAGIGCKQASRHLALRFRGGLTSRGVTLSLTGVAAISAVALHVQRGAVLPNPSLLEFERLCKGRFLPFEYAMIFVGPHKSPGGAPIHEAPAMLYAAHLLGTAQVVSSTYQAFEQWERWQNKFSNLRYVIFFGLDAPSQIWSEGSLIYQDEAGEITAFQLY